MLHLSSGHLMAAGGTGMLAAAAAAAAGLPMTTFIPTSAPMSMPVMNMNMNMMLPALQLTSAAGPGGAPVGFSASGLSAGMITAAGGGSGGGGGGSGAAAAGASTNGGGRAKSGSDVRMDSPNSSETSLSGGGKHDDNGSDSPTDASRRITVSIELPEARALVRLRTAADEQFSKSRKSHLRLWQEIANQLQEQGFTAREPYQLAVKWKNLLSKLKGASASWPLYHELRAYKEAHMTPREHGSRSDGLDVPARGGTHELRDRDRERDRDRGEPPIQQDGRKRQRTMPSPPVAAVNVDPRVVERYVAIQERQAALKHAELEAAERDFQHAVTAMNVIVALRQRADDTSRQTLDHAFHAVLAPPSSQRSAVIMLCIGISRPGSEELLQRFPLLLQQLNEALLASSSISPHHEDSHQAAT